MRFIKEHMEWSVFIVGLIALGVMDPTTAGVSFCAFDWAGINFCPGEGLGHSISYTFRADFNSAFQAHFFGPFAVVILSLRILHLWRNLYLKQSFTNKKDNHG